ncbi:MAG: CatA-like O-acetyltransferase [Aquabacterium sp.]
MYTHPTKTRIDLATYPRADILQAFVHRQMPQFSVTCEVEITALKKACDERGVSFFLAISHAVSMAVNAVPQLRHRMIDNELYEFERTDPGYTVAREGDLFSFCDGVHLDDFSAYCAEAQQRMAAVREAPDLAVYEKHHMFFISCLPWLAFTAFTHPYDPIYAYIPVITLGKFVERGSEVVMPVGAQVHHGTVDGVHIARFYSELQARAAAAPSWLHLKA